MNALFSPCLLFLLPDEWVDEVKRDRFLRHLLDHLEWLEEFDEVGPYWSDELEATLWTDPQLPPWRLDRDWKLQILPVIHRRFTRKQMSIYVPPEIDPARMLPNNLIYRVREDIIAAFLRLVHAVLLIDQRPYLCTGLQDQVGEQQLTFECTCHAYHVPPIVVATGEAWLAHIDLVDKYWPTEVRDEGKLRKLLIFTLTERRRLENLRSAFSFTDEFIKNLIGEQTLRRDVVDALCARLVRTQLEAVQDRGLRDESIYGQEGIRRFRVTRAARIHYEYRDGNEIVFRTFYGKGEHDDGL